ncbi:MAG: HU family DNA-binding protein [Cyclobacteriaceae bacterium]
MPVTYTIAMKKPGLSPDAAPKYYPVLTDRRITNLRKLCYMISDRSTLTSADVMGVIHAMIELIPDLLQDGRTVRLDGFGTFNLHASSEGQTNPDKITSRDITGVRMSFLPDKDIKRRLNKTKFVKKDKS